MPRPQRNYLDGGCYHITHRCHERKYLFKFAKHRRLYFDTLRETARRYAVDVLNYTVTSNHTHLLLWARYGQEISRAIQFLHGTVGQAYNRLKNRQGAFWTDRHHATLIQTGNHLSRCLFYIDFNMIRAGAVDHPAEWDTAGCRELLGFRRRYCVINRKRLLKCLDIPEWETFLEWYERTIEQEVASQYHHRQAFWTEALAVGDPKWLESVADRVSTRKRKAIVTTDEASTPIIAESGPIYYLTSPDRAGVKPLDS